MWWIILLVIILGTGIGIITFFLIKMLIFPKKLASIQNLLKQGKTQQVIRIARQIIAKEPRNCEAHYLLGLAYIEEKKPELALMEYKKINQIGAFGGICPEAEFRNRSAELYISFDQPEEALKEYLLLIKMYPQNDEYYLKAGTLFESRNRTDRAFNYYRKAIEMNPHNGPAHFKLGYLLYRSKQFLESKVEFELSIKIDPNNYQSYYYLGRIQKENHDFTGALVAFERSQKDPDFKVRSLVERGACYMSMNSLERAITELERAIKLAANDSSNESLFGRYLLALCYEKNREIDKAVGNWEIIYSKKPAFRDVAEKLTQYQDIRTDDRMKDYLTSSLDEFYAICRLVAKSLNLNIRDVQDIPKGCQIIAVDAETKWRNMKKQPKLLWFMRNPELVTDLIVRDLYEEMRKFNVSRGMILSSSNFSRKAIDFTENRPIDLINKDKLQEYLKSINISDLDNEKTVVLENRRP